MPAFLTKLRDEDAEQDQRGAAHPCEADNAIYFRAHGIRPNIQFTSSDTMSGAAMVAAGLGITTSNGIIAEELGDNVVKVPVIASGGAGCIQDFITLFKALPGVDAGLAASIFHFGEVAIKDLKLEMQKNGIPARV